MRVWRREHFRSAHRHSGRQSERRGSSPVARVSRFVTVIPGPDLQPESEGASHRPRPRLDMEVAAQVWYRKRHASLTAPQVLAVNLMTDTQVEAVFVASEFDARSPAPRRAGETLTTVPCQAKRPGRFQKSTPPRSDIGPGQDAAGSASKPLEETTFRLPISIR